MPLPTLTLSQARLVHLSAQGLLNPPSAQADKEAVLQTIRRMGLLQIDTIHVVARSPYFVLFSRLGDYSPAWLEDLLAEGRIFEQWAHAACFLPQEDFPLIRRLILAGTRDTYFSGWIDRNLVAVETVRQALDSNGAVRSADFKSEKGPGGWWNWKAEKSALEYLFSRGEVMVVRRDNFQRVYDLTSRVLPDWEDGSLPSLDEVYRELIRRSVRALGIARPSWVADYYRLPKSTVKPLLSEMVHSGALLEGVVEGWSEPVLTVAENLPLIEAATKGKLKASCTTLLSPFDPVIWDRERARQLFGFDFMIQAYTKAEKRQYGYFPLPLLYEDRLIARVDAKANRATKCFEIKGFYLEPGIVPHDPMAQAVAAALQRTASWHQTPKIILSPEVNSGCREWLSPYLISD